MSKRSKRNKRAAKKPAAKKPATDRGEPAGDDAPEKARKPRPKVGSAAWLIDWAKTLAFALIIFLFLRTFVIESFVISSGSMEGTLLVGDFLLVNKVVLGGGVPGTGIRLPGYGDVEHGEIVVFRADHAPGLDIVKRVIGVPGDTLWMGDGVLYRNGAAPTERYVRHDAAVEDVNDPTMAWQLQHLAPGVDPSEYRPTRDNWGPIVVPPERYFMLGDNREHSLDSRFWGLVERRKMKGKPFFVYYSYDKEAIKPFPWLLAMRLGRIGPSP